MERKFLRLGSGGSMVNPVARREPVLVAIKQMLLVRETTVVRARTVFCLRLSAACRRGTTAGNAPRRPIAGCSGSVRARGCQPATTDSRAAASSGSRR